ncbi:MAG: UDP-N-acetylmuramate--L-alanine ligase [Propionibacterium sp.]|nr:UDP-N-acetylmuramate--L-alanine ligase [Propionibacterium sp.]
MGTDDMDTRTSHTTGDPRTEGLGTGPGKDPAHAGTSGRGSAATGGDHVPGTPRAFHFIGIGGAGMSVVAELLADRGLPVSGSDTAASPVVAPLRGLGITVHVGHDPANVPPEAIVVVSSAIRDSNVELAAARARGQQVIHRSQALALAAAGMRFVAVAGAHGKTTTSAMLALALQGVGMDPSAAIGGVIPELGTGAHLGSGDVFVAEADESDGSFLNYTPSIELVTNVEPDHLDHYRTREAFEQVFVEFVERLVPGGLLVCCAEDQGAARLAAAARLQGHRVLTYGRPEKCGSRPDVGVEDVVEGPQGSTARLTLGGVRADLVLEVPGWQNVVNAAGAWTVGVELGGDPAAMAAALAHFRGAERRFQLRGEVGGRRVFDDYAHHPTEVAAALAEARVVAGQGPVTVVFQPHLFSRTKAFAERFARALSAADAVVVTDIYAAREDPVPGIDSSLITRHLPGSHLVPDMHEAARVGARLTGPGGVLVTMGAGSITHTAADVVEEWRREETRG